MVLGVEKMERIQIKKRKDANSSEVNTTNYDFYFDGVKQEMKWVKSINIELDAAKNPIVTIVSRPKSIDLDIDGEVEKIEETYLDGQ